MAFANKKQFVPTNQLSGPNSFILSTSINEMFPSKYAQKKNW